MRIATKIFLTLVVSTVAVQLHAQIYKWTDENGQVHFSQSKPVARDSDEVRIKKSPVVDPVEQTESQGGDNGLREGQGQVCTSGSDYITVGKNVVCCNSRCVKERYSKGLEFDCYAQECNSLRQELMMEKWQAENKKKQQRWEAERKKAAERREAEKQQTADRNQSVVDECNKRRETYCNEGADRIRSIEKFKAEEQKWDRIKQRENYQNY